MLLNICVFFRVEILENIFSLLFLRYEDFHEETSSDSGANDDDADHDPKVHRSEVIPKSFDGADYKRTQGTDMTSFQQISDVSSSLRTMPVIEAHVTGSPPLDNSNVFSDETLCHLPLKARDVAINTFTAPSQVKDVLSLTRISVESPVKISSQETGLESCPSPISNTLNKLSSSVASPFASASNSAQDTHRTAKVPTLTSVKSATLSSNVTSDLSETSGDAHQYTKIQERRKSARSNHADNADNAENASIRSGASSATVKGTQQGFICNQYLIRDLLHCLKECLVETSAAFYRSLTADTADLRRVQVVSSVEPELLQQRMNR
jgi:hypothetical protein